MVITSYNYARFLCRCIDSALDQTVVAEVVVVDDRSTDGSRDLIDSYGDDIRSIVFNENRGQAGALNAGIKAAAGEIVFFLDSDDWAERDRVERVLTAFASRRHTNMMRHDARIADHKGRLLAERQYGLRAGDPADDVRRFGRTPGSTGTLAARKGFLEDLGPIPEDCYRTSPDYYLLLAAALSGTLGTMEDALTTRRRHDAQLTHRFATDPSSAVSSLTRRHCEAQSAAELATRFGAWAEVALARTWWQRKAEYEYAKAIGGGRPWRRPWVRHLAETARGPLPGTRATAEVLRSLCLGLLPRRFFLPAWWWTHVGRPKVWLIDQLGSARTPAGQQSDMRPLLGK